MSKHKVPLWQNRTLVCRAKRYDVLHTTEYQPLKNSLRALGKAVETRVGDLGAARRREFSVVVVGGIESPRKVEVVVVSVVRYGAAILLRI